MQCESSIEVLDTSSDEEEQGKSVRQEEPIERNIVGDSTVVDRLD
jgi:hypothetical protein